MIVDPSTLPYWTCENGCVSRYPAAPRICPRSGCGSRTFQPATDDEVRAEARSAKAASAERGGR